MPPRRPPGLDRLSRLVLHEHDRAALERELQQIVRESLGEASTFSIDGAVRPGRPPSAAGTGMVHVPVGERAFLTVPTEPAPPWLDDVADRLRVLLADYDALEHERLRASRLESLYEAAHVLTAELDVDRILARIVEQGRSLTGADACYLSLNDLAHEETYFRATSGIRTEAFRTLRLKYGHGLGGLVASEARSYRSDDYVHDPRFVHVVDPIVREEGVASVIGVPLKLGAEVLGVLFVASRQPATFSDEDVGACEELAEHAAVAIANAQLHGRLRREQALQDRLTDLALEAHDISSLAHGIGEALGHRVEIVVSVRGDGRPDPPDRENAGEDPVVETPIRAGNTDLGTLRVHAGEVDAEGARGLDQAARVAALHILRERAVAQAELRSRSELLAAVGDRRLPERELIERARHFGLDLERPHRVVVVDGEVTTTAGSWPPELFAAGRLGTTVVLVPDGAAAPAVDQVAGLSGVAAGPAAIAQAIDEAARTLAIGRMLGRTGLVTEADLGPLAMLIDPARAATLRGQAERTLAPLLEHDRAGSGGLVVTLKAFLEAQGRPGEAAAACHVHVNTLYYRLERIRALTGWDLADPDLRLHLHLACRVLDLTQSDLEQISN